MASSPVTPASLEGETPSPIGNEEPATTRQVHASVPRLASHAPLTFHSRGRVRKKKQQQHAELHLKPCEFNTFSGICEDSYVQERDCGLGLSQQKLPFNSA